MSVETATIAVVSLYAYLGIGFAVMLWMHLGGLRRIDASAATGSPGFKIIISPGLALLWPVVLVRAVRGAGHPPVERNAHRDRAGKDGL